MAEKLALWRIGRHLPANRERSLLLLRQSLSMVVVLGLLACTGKPTTLQDKSMSAVTSYVGDIKLPVGVVPGHPWATRACKPGQREADVLACVDGVAIPRSRFDAVQPTYPAGTPPRAIVQALVDEEILAHAAAKTLWGDWLQEPLHRLLVGRLLQDQMEAKLGPDQISPDDVKAAWAVKQVRHSYDRPEIYTVTDAQLICCTGDFRQCSEAESAVKCVNEMEPTARALAAYLNENPPQTVQEMHGRVGADPRFAKAAVVEVSFFWEPTKSYAEQKGYTLMVESFTQATLKLKPGEITREPVRSPFGWHVIRLDTYVPASHKGLEDPAILADLKKNLVPALRDQKVQKLISDLAKASDVQVYLTPFDSP